MNQQTLTRAYSFEGRGLHPGRVEDAGERVAVVVRPGGSVMLRSDRHILRIHIVLHIRATL